MSLRSKIFHLAHPDRVAAYRDFPGPQPSFPLGNQGPLLRKPAFEVCDQIAREHGKLALIWIKSRPVLIVSDERLAMGVLAHGKDAFEVETPDSLLGLSGRMHESLSLTGLGHDSVYRNGEAPPCLVQAPWLFDWLEPRMPALQAALLERAGAFAQETREAPGALFSALLRVVFGSLTRLTLGQELSSQAFDDFLELALGKARKAAGFEALEERDDLLGTPRERILQAIGTQIAMGQRYPDEHREDLIGHLLEGRFALPESQWAEAFLRVYQSTCLQIASGLTSAMHQLTHHPAALEQLELELDRADEVPSLHSLMNLPVLDSVYHESLRFAPPMPLIGRRVKNNRQVDLDGRSIPAGTGILIHLGLLQRSPSSWEEPERFDPGRWQNSDGPLLDSLSETGLAHGAARLGGPYEPISEWMSKLVLFNWLRSHTVLAGESDSLAKADRFISGLRLPTWTQAHMYPRGERALQGQMLPIEQSKGAIARSLTLLPGNLRFGASKTRPKEQKESPPRKAGH